MPPSTSTSRRDLIRTGAALGAALLAPGWPLRAAQVPLRRRPVIDCTDLYHPPQDPGDNVDLVAAYALPEVDLRAVILDVTEPYRHDLPRDPGFIPVTQLNFIFGRNVPCAVTPFAAMRDPEDRMLDAPAFQQAGIELLLETLRRSREPVDITSFGSARAVAVAYNREPRLLREKVRLVHLCAGSSEPGFVEWNVALDPHAFVRVLRSGLPVAIYPCATKDGPFAYGPHNCFYLLPDLQFIREMAPRLRQYLVYAFTNAARPDFLCYLDEQAPEEVLAQVCGRAHNVWETSVWAQVSDRRTVQHRDGAFRVVPAAEVGEGDRALPNELRPCRVAVDDDATMHWEPAATETGFRIYDRGDPHENERALRQALPALYLSFGR